MKVEIKRNGRLVECGGWDEPKRPFDLREFAKEVHQLAVEKGWYSPSKTDIEALALVGCEVSEAIEEVRKNTNPIYYTGDDYKPEGELIELADVVIRILDYCEYKKYDLIEAMSIKHVYNKQRPYRHGGKKA